VSEEELRRLASRLHAALNARALALAALGDIVASLPRCCRCERAIAVVMTRDRWWLCEACWRTLPWPEAHPAHDLIAVVERAIALLR